MKNISLNKELKRIADNISKYYAPEKIILFGSAAKGKFSTGSDLDLMIVKDTNRNQWDRIIDVDQYIEHNFAIDILVYTPDEIKERLQLNDFFIKEIIEEGKVLYEKKSKTSSRMARKSKRSN